MFNSANIKKEEVMENKDLYIDFIKKSKKFHYLIIL